MEDETFKGLFVIECKVLSKDPILEPSKSKALDSESQGDDDESILQASAVEPGKENAVQAHGSERS